MTIFQAYCIDINYDDDTFVLTFPDPNVGDEWWRAISDTPTIASLFTRVNPQFYTYTATSLKVSDFFIDSQTQAIASNFRGRLFITKVDEKIGRGPPLVQSVNVASVTNENWFFIRSITTPHLYWFFDSDSYTSGTYPPLTVSETACTRFKAQCSNSNFPQHKVLIDKDWVNLQVYAPTPLHVGYGQSKYTYLCVSSVKPSYGYTLKRWKTGMVVRANKHLECLDQDMTSQIWEFVG